MTKLQNIYDNSPIIIQNLIVSLSGFNKFNQRYGRIYFEHRKFLKEFDSWEKEKKINYQLKKLNEFINFARKNSKFYKKLYSNIPDKPLNEINDLKRFPIITKEMIRENLDEIITIPKWKGIISHTGGTTGKSLEVVFTKEDVMRRMAMLDHFKSRFGFENRLMRRATFNGQHIVPPNQKNKIFWRYNISCKQMIYSSFHTSEENLKYYCESLNSFKPQSIDGFFSSIVDLASYIKRKKIKLKFKPIAIFPTSEKVLKEDKELIEEVFQCKVYDQYASSEGAPFITECEKGNLHIELSTGVFEFIDENSKEIVVTSFDTKGTPLIRYRIGDSIEAIDFNFNCSCGIQSPIVKEINGRTTDFLVTIDGVRINAGNVANLFKNLHNSVIKSQIVQVSKDNIIIKLVVDKRIYKKEYDNQLHDEFLHKFGSKMKIEIQHVEEIEKESSGKYRFIINRI